jgi:hypothetical protein
MIIEVWEHFDVGGDSKIPIFKENDPLGACLGEMPTSMVP